MKRFGLFAILASLFSVSSAQDSLSITTTYLGVLYGGSYQTTESGELQQGVTVRGGLAGFVPLGHETRLDIWAGMDFPSNSPIGRFSIARSFGAVQAQLGYMPRPMPVIFRPFPLSGDGQFEASATAVMPGKATGLTLSWEGIQAGPYWVPARKAFEWNVGIVRSLGPVELQGAGFAGPLQKGVAVGCKSDVGGMRAFWTSDSIRSVLVDANVAAYFPYFSLVWNAKTRSPQQWEVGVARAWQSPICKCLVGLEYASTGKVVNVFVMVHL